LKPGEDVLDMEAINNDIAGGAKAFNLLLKHANDAAGDWTNWAAVIQELRALRNLAFAQSHTSDIHSWHYRQAIGALLARPKYSVYGRIDKPTRSQCYKLMDNLEEIGTWYNAFQDWARISRPKSSRALLKDFEIRPVVVHPTKRADLSRHGYRAAQFEDAFARFLSPEPNIRTLKRGGGEKT
jgi:hypothetical protein